MREIGINHVCRLLVNTLFSLLTSALWVLMVDPSAEALRPTTIVVQPCTADRPSRPHATTRAIRWQVQWHILASERAVGATTSGTAERTGNERIDSTNILLLCTITQRNYMPVDGGEGIANRPQNQELDPVDGRLDSKPRCVHRQLLPELVTAWLCDRNLLHHCQLRVNAASFGVPYVGSRACMATRWLLSRCRLAQNSGAARATENMTPHAVQGQNPLVSKHGAADN